MLDLNLLHHAVLHIKQLHDAYMVEFNEITSESGIVSVLLAYALDDASLTELAVQKVNTLQKLETLGQTLAKTMRQAQCVSIFSFGVIPIDRQGWAVITPDAKESTTLPHFYIELSQLSSVLKDNSLASAWRKWIVPGALVTRYSEPQLARQMILAVQWNKAETVNVTLVTAPFNLEPKVTKLLPLAVFVNFSTPSSPVVVDVTTTTIASAPNVVRAPCEFLQITHETWSSDMFVHLDKRLFIGCWMV